MGNAASASDDAIARAPTLLSSHARGLPHRLRAEFGDALDRHWIYAQARCVVILDVRRSALLWSRQPHDALDCVLGALARGHSAAGGAIAVTAVHVTVAIGAREGWPLRVLVQGYHQRCGEPDAADAPMDDRDETDERRWRKWIELDGEKVDVAIRRAVAVKTEQLERSPLVQIVRARHLHEALA